MNQYASTNSLLTATNGYGVWQDICSAFVSAGYAGPFDVSGWSAQLLSTTAGIYSNPIFDGNATIAGTLNVSPTMTMTPNHIGINMPPRSEALAINGNLLVRGTFKSPAALTADIISVATQTDYIDTAAHLPVSTRSALIQYSDASRYTIYLPSPTSVPALPLAHSLIVHNQTERPLSISVQDGTAILDVSSSVATAYLPPSEARQFVLGRACTCPVACSHTESNTTYMYYQRPFIGPDFPSLAPYVDLSAGAAILSAIATDASAVTGISTIIAQRPTQAAISTLSTGISVQNGAYNTLSTYVGTSTATQTALQDLSGAAAAAATEISALAAVANSTIQVLVTPAQISSFSTSLASLTSEISHLSSYVYSESTATLANYSTVSSTVRDLSAAIQDISASLTQIATAADFAAVSSAFSTTIVDFSTLSATFDSIKARDVTRADYNQQVSTFSTTIKDLTALSTSIAAAYKYYSTPVLSDQYAGMSTHFYEMQNTHVIYTYNSYYSANMTELSTYIGDLTEFDSTLRAQIDTSTATTQDLSTLSSSLLNVFTLSTYVGASVPTKSTISTLYRTDASNRSSINTLSNYIALNVPSKTQYATLETAAAVYNTKENALAAYIYGSADPGAASKAALSTVGDGVEFISTGISSLEAYIGVSTIPLSTFTDLSAAFISYSTGTVKLEDVSTVTGNAGIAYNRYMSTIRGLDSRVYDISSYAHTSLADAVEYSTIKNTFTGFCLSNYTTASTTVYVSAAKLTDYVAISSLISTSYATPYGTLSSYIAASTLTVQAFNTFSTNITNDLTDSVAALYANPEIIGDFLINSTNTTAIIKPIGARAVPGTAGGPLYIVGDPSGGINARSRVTVFTTWLGDEGAGGVTAEFKGALSNVGGTFSGDLVNATGSFRGALNTTGDLTVESGSITAARGNLILDNSDIHVENGNIYAQTFYGNINGPSYSDAITQLDTSQNIRTAGDLTVGYSLFGSGRTDISSLVVDQILLKPNLVPLAPPRPFEAQQFTEAAFDVDASGMGVQVAAGYPVVFAWRELVYKINVANFQRYPPNGWAPVVFSLDKAYEFFTLEIRQEADGLMTVPGQDIDQHTAGYIRITGRAGYAQALDVEFELAHGSTATPLFQDITFSGQTGAYGYLTVWLWVGQTGIQADEVVYQWRGTNHVQLAGFAGNTDTVVVNETSYAFRGIGAFQPQPPFAADGGGIMVSGKTDLMGTGLGGSIVAQAEGVDGVMLGVNRLDPAYNLDVSGMALVSPGPVDICGGVVAGNVDSYVKLTTDTIDAKGLPANVININRTTAQGDAKTSVSGDVFVSGVVTSGREAAKTNYTILVYCDPVNGVVPVFDLSSTSCCANFAIDITTLKSQYSNVNVIGMGGGGGGGEAVENTTDVYTATGVPGNNYTININAGGGGGSGHIYNNQLKTSELLNNINIGIGLGGSAGVVASTGQIQELNKGWYTQLTSVDGGFTFVEKSSDLIRINGGMRGNSSGLVSGGNGLYGGGGGLFVDTNTKTPGKSVLNTVVLKQTLDGSGANAGYYTSTNGNQSKIYSGQSNPYNDVYTYTSGYYHSYYIYAYTPAGGGGGPYGANAAYFTQNVTDGESYSSYVSASKASFGCGGGGGVIPTQYFANDGGFHSVNIGNYNGYTASRGGDGWVLLEFYNEEPYYNLNKIGPSGRFFDIRDVIEPALKFADQKYVLSQTTLQKLLNIYTVKRPLGIFNFDYLSNLSIATNFIPMSQLLPKVATVLRQNLYNITAYATFNNNIPDPKPLAFYEKDGTPTEYYIQTAKGLYNQDPILDSGHVVSPITASELASSNVLYASNIPYSQTAYPNAFKFITTPSTYTYTTADINTIDDYKYIGVENDQSLPRILVATRDTIGSMGIQVGGRTVFDNTATTYIIESSGTEFDLSGELLDFTYHIYTRQIYKTNENTLCEIFLYLWHPNWAGYKSSNAIPAKLPTQLPSSNGTAIIINDSKLSNTLAIQLLFSTAPVTIQALDLIIENLIDIIIFAISTIPELFIP